MVEWILNPTKQVSSGMAVLILVLNIFIPGLGTAIYGRILRGIVEFVTAFILVGLIFSIIDGVQILSKATKGSPAIDPGAI